MRCTACPSKAIPAFTQIQTDLSPATVSFADRPRFRDRRIAATTEMVNPIKKASPVIGLARLFWIYQVEILRLTRQEFNHGVRIHWQADIATGRFTLNRCS